MSDATRLLPGDWGWFDDRLVQLIDQGVVGVTATVVAVVIAAGVGVAHALGPGHGKVLIAAYLAGTQGQRRDAVALGILVAAMHTGSVLVLGLAYLLLQRVPGGERFSAVLDLVVAAAVVAIGIGLVVRTRRGRGHHHHPVPGAGPDTTGEPDTSREPDTTGKPDTSREPDPRHTPDTPHTPDSPRNQPTRPGMLTLAAAGGLVPSPAAFLALVTALAIGRPWLGLALVGGFSLGLAATLAGIGLLVVTGRERAEHLPKVASRLHWLPGIAAIGVVLAGLLLLVRAVANL